MNIHILDYYGLNRETFKVSDVSQPPEFEMTAGNCNVSNCHFVLVAFTSESLLIFS